MTNFEKIKAMSVEEMAEFLLNRISRCEFCMFKSRGNCVGFGCLDGIRRKLESEVEEDG